MGLDVPALTQRRYVVWTSHVLIVMQSVCQKASVRGVNVSQICVRSSHNHVILLVADIRESILRNRSLSPSIKWCPNKCLFTVIQLLDATNFSTCPPQNIFLKPGWADVTLGNTFSQTNRPNMTLITNLQTTGPLIQEYRILHVHRCDCNVNEFYYFKLVLFQHYPGYVLFLTQGTITLVA